MNRKPIYRLLLLILLPVASAFSQQTATAQKDSSDTPFARPDTLQTIPVHSSLFWYDIYDQMHERLEKHDPGIYNFRQQKSINYSDFSDVLHNSPGWTEFDLKEHWRPSYLAAPQLFPHQTVLRYNGIVMNEITTGLFDSQYIPLNFIRVAQVSPFAASDAGLGFGSSSVLHVVPMSRHSKAPWSKIVYKQGNYGFSDLDLIFVKPVSENFAVQLGGENRLYDGLLNNSSAELTNYRAEVTWQYRPDLFARAQMFLNRTRAGLTSFDNFGLIGLPRHIELRDDYFFDLTWLPVDSSRQRFHLTLYNSYVHTRLLDNFNNQFYLSEHSKRYGARADYNFTLGPYSLLAGGTAQLNRAWGTTFSRTYEPTILQGFARVEIPFDSLIVLDASVQSVYHEGFNPQLMPAAGVSFRPGKNHRMHANLSRTARFPNLYELYFDAFGLSGNSILKPEEFITAYGSYRFQPRENLYAQIDYTQTRVRNEINWTGGEFVSSTNDRDFGVIGVQGGFDWWRFDFSTGGHWSLTDTPVTAGNSAWLRIHFHDIWLNGAVKVDAYSTVRYFGSHQNIRFDPRIHRFFTTAGETNPYDSFDWKIVGTVQDAEIFFEMENSFSNEFEVVYGYREFSQRWRFGVNWRFWD